MTEQALLTEWRGPMHGGGWAWTGLVDFPKPWRQCPGLTKKQHKLFQVLARILEPGIFTMQATSTKRTCVKKCFRRGRGGESWKALIQWAHHSYFTESIVRPSEGRISWEMGHYRQHVQAAELPRHPSLPEARWFSSGSWPPWLSPLHLPPPPSLCWLRVWPRPWVPLSPAPRAASWRERSPGSAVRRPCRAEVAAKGRSVLGQHRSSCPASWKLPPASARVLGVVAGSFGAAAPALELQSL